MAGLWLPFDLSDGKTLPCAVDDHLPPTPAADIGMRDSQAMLGQVPLRRRGIEFVHMYDA